MASNRFFINLTSNILNMRTLTLICLLLSSFAIEAQLAPVPSHLNKRILLAHPTKSNLEVLYALHHNQLLNLNNIQLIGIYHKDETYDYSESITMLDTMDYLNMHIIPLTDTLHPDSLYCSNACTATFTNLFNESEGLILFGGPDIPPAIYGEEAHKQTKITDPYRHYFEASLVYHLIGGYQNNEYTGLLERNPDYFIFGICLGMQTMNIASGGTLIQDIPTEIYNSIESQGLEHLNTEEVHRNFYPFMAQHKTKELAGSHFHKIILTDYFFPDFVQIDPDFRPMVNSYHHQAVEILSKGFKVGATSSDGKIIEAIFHTRFPNVFAVQFHPERAQLFLNTKLYQFTPNGEKDVLSRSIDNRSLAFHYKLWQSINALIHLS